MQRPLVSVFLGISLDGCIAGPGGDLRWLEPYSTDPPEATGYAALMARCDTLLIGRRTHDAAAGFADWPYAGKRVVVLTHRPIDARHGEDSARGPIGEVLAALHAAGSRHVYLDGGAVVREALAAGVVDELTLSWVPVILGDGLRLFAAGLPISAWRPVGSRILPSGLVQASWRPA